MNATEAQITLAWILAQRSYIVPASTRSRPGEDSVPAVVLVTIA